MDGLVVWLLVCLAFWGGSIVLAGALAQHKGYSRLDGYAVGFLLSAVGVLILLLLPPKKSSHALRINAPAVAPLLDWRGWVFFALLCGFWSACMVVLWFI